MVKFDHDFVGREALEEISKNPKRTKVTLALNSADVMKAMGTMFEKANRAKFIDFPSAVYSTWPYDKVMKNGKTIGISTWVGYSSNEGKMLTLAILDNEHAQSGNEVTFVWGEQPGSGAAHGREPRSGGDPRHGLPRALRRSGAGSLSHQIESGLKQMTPEAARASGAVFVYAITSLRGAARRGCSPGRCTRSAHL